MSNHLNDFNWTFYLYANKDLVKAEINNKEKAEKHFIDFGRKEKRIYNYNNYSKDFDPDLYLAFNKNINNDNNLFFSPLFHWVLYGYKENRIYNLEGAKNILPDFNWVKYLDINKDLIYENINNESKAICHYVKNGKNENRKIISDLNMPNNFNLKDYKINKNLNNIENTNKNYINLNVFKNISNKLDTDFYKKYYNYPDNFTKDKIINEWITKGRFEKKIFFNKFNKNVIKSDFGIAVTIYCDEYTPIERIEATYLFLNSLVINFINNFILILIDNKIDSKLLNFIKNLRSYYKNISIYINKKNYGISISKNICLKILNQIDYLSYYCLLDDDMDIIRNFENYTKNIIINTKIPILSNFNKQFVFKDVYVNNTKLIKTKHYLGNILILKKNALNKYGYFNKFTAKWGDEHLEITKRYLKNTNFRNRACDLQEYIIDSINIGNINTLHLHSCRIDQKEYLINKKEHKRYLKKIKYVDFKFNFNKIKEI